MYWNDTALDTTMMTQSMGNNMKQKPMSFKLLLRLYYLPFFIFVLGFGLYYFIFQLYIYDIGQEMNPNLTNEALIPLETTPIASVPILDPIESVAEPQTSIAIATEPTESVVPKIDATEPAAPNLVNANTFVVDVRSLNVRNNPKSGAPIIAAISRGDIVEIMHQENGWAQIDVNGTKGYVTTRFLRPLDSNIAHTPVPNAPETTSTTYEVVSNGINVREAPSTSARVVAKKSQNDSIVAIEEKNGWVRTQEGWIYKNLLKLKGE